MKKQKVYSLTAEVALEILSNARALLYEYKKSASIVIVNALGFEIAKLVMEGAKSASVSIAYFKAEQSARMGHTTRTIRDRISSGETTAEILGIDPNHLIKWAGGVPIYDEEGNLLGGLGISNLTEDEDEEFAIKALNFADGLSHKKDA